MLKLGKKVTIFSKEEGIDICFDLRKVKIFRKPSDINKLSVGEKKNKMNFKRIGRLLPPYINALQRKYAHFVTRPGEWRDPDQD